MGFNSAAGNQFASAVAFMRDGYGGTFGIGGKLYPATVQSVGGDTVADMAATFGVNGANADFHTIRYSPGVQSTDGTTTVPEVTEETDVTITAQGTEAYRVADVEAPTVAGVAHTIVLTVYRKAAADSATTAPAGETNAGQVKVYDRPQNPL